MRHPKPADRKPVRPSLPADAPAASARRPSRSSAQRRGRRRAGRLRRHLGGHPGGHRAILRPAEKSSESGITTPLRDRPRPYPGRRAIAAGHYRRRDCQRSGRRSGWHSRLYSDRHSDRHSDRQSDRQPARRPPAQRASRQPLRVPALSAPKARRGPGRPSAPPWGRRRRPCPPAPAGKPVRPSR